MVDEARRSTLGIAVLATTLSVGLHAALLSIALRHAGRRSEAAPRAPVILSLAAPAPMAAVEAPAASAPAREPPAAAPPDPQESLPPPVDSAAAVPPPRRAEASASDAEPLPLAADAAPSQPLAEAPPFTNPGPLPDPSIPAEAPAVEPTAPAIQAARGTPGAVGLGGPPAPAALAPAEALPVAGAGPPQPPAGAAVQPSAVVVPAAPSMDGEASASSAQGEAPARVAAPALAEAAPVGETPPISPPAATAPPGRAPDVAEAPARDAVAALEPPETSSERVRGFVDRYDGGPCFFASVAGTGAAGVDIEAFSPAVDRVMAFHAAFMGQIGVEPRVIGQKVWSAQCRVVDLLRAERARDGARPRIELDRRAARAGEMVTGTVKDVGLAEVALFLVSEGGAVTDLSGALARTGPDRPFAWRIAPRQGGGPYPQLIVAAVEAKPSKAPPSFAAAVQDLLRSSADAHPTMDPDLRMIGAFFLIGG